MSSPFQDIPLDNIGGNAAPPAPSMVPTPKPTHAPIQTPRPVPPPPVQTPRPTPSQPPPPEGKRPRKNPVGPTVGIIIIVILMIFGALYFWGAHLNAKDQNQQLPLIPGDATTTIQK